MGKSRIGRVFSVAAAVGRRQSPAMPQLPKTWLTTRRFEGEAKNGSRNNHDKIDR
jgi:hypothetical protein